MRNIPKRSLAKSGGYLVQPVFIIGTYNEDNSPNFSTVTSVSYAFGPPESLIISLYGSKRTKENLSRDNVFTANLCTVEMGRLADYVGMVSGMDQTKEAMPFDSAPGRKINAPVLDASPYVMECNVLQTHQLGDTHIVIAEIVNNQVGEDLGLPENDSDNAYLDYLNTIDIHDADPLLYTWKYYRVGEKIGNLGELAAELLS